MKEITIESLIEYGFVVDRFEDNKTVYYHIIDKINDCRINFRYGVMPYSDGAVGLMMNMFDSQDSFSEFHLDFEYVEQFDVLVRALIGDMSLLN